MNKNLYKVDERRDIDQEIIEYNEVEEMEVTKNVEKTRKLDIEVD